MLKQLTTGGVASMSGLAPFSATASVEGRSIAFDVPHDVDVVGGLCDLNLNAFVAAARRRTAVSAT